MSRRREPRWWVLQIMMRDHAQLKMPFREKPDRRAVIADAFETISRGITTTMFGVDWGLINWTMTRNGGAADLVRPMAGPPPIQRTGPGSGTRLFGLQDAASVFVFPEQQRVFVERHRTLAPDASAPARALQKMFVQALLALGVRDLFADVTIQPMGTAGQLTRWWLQAGGARRLFVEFAGRNLPEGHDPDFLAEVEELLDASRDKFGGEKAGIQVTQPSLSEEQVAALDRGATKRRLKLRAVASRPGVRPWSSESKLRPIQVEFRSTDSTAEFIDRLAAKARDPNLYPVDEEGLDASRSP